MKGIWEGALIPADKQLEEALRHVNSKKPSGRSRADFKKNCKVKSEKNHVA